MKTVFILNPKAGKGKQKEKLKEVLVKTIAEKGLDAQVYVTKYPGDATRFVRDYCRENGAARFIACGGDGTLSEVLNGVVGFHGAELGVLPVGSGNDFCRNFPKDTAFGDVYLQAVSDAVDCDAIRYTTTVNGETLTGYCANMFNIGFDCNVADLTQTLKNYPLLNGSMAYLAAVVGMLVKKKGANLKVELDGEVVENGPLLLTAIANGGFCGGGVNSAPTASINDGVMDVNVVYNISRVNFIKKFPYYSKGTHMELPDLDEFLLFKTCKKAVITPLDNTMRLCVDGEIVDAGEVTMEMMPLAVNVLVPKAR